MADTLILLDDVQFTKNSYINRVRVKGPNGPHWLTVPVTLPEGNETLINQVKYSEGSWTDQRWRKKHIKTITQNYQKCPMFKRYSPLLFKFLKNCGGGLNFMNNTLIHWAIAQLKIRVKIVNSHLFQTASTGSLRLARLVKAVGGQEYVHGSGGLNYQDQAVFKEHGISLIQSDFKEKPYDQPWGDFVPGLSVIDYLFNVGEYAP